MEYWSHRLGIACVPPEPCTVVVHRNAAELGTNVAHLFVYQYADYIRILGKGRKVSYDPLNSATRRAIVALLKKYQLWVLPTKRKAFPKDKFVFFGQFWGYLLENASGLKQFIGLINDPMRATMFENNLGMWGRGTRSLKDTKQLIYMLMDIPWNS